jgi:hypothetical protein
MSKKPIAQLLVDLNRRGMEAFENGDLEEALSIHETLSVIQDPEFWKDRRATLMTVYGDDPVDPELVQELERICDIAIQRLLET